MTSARVRSRVAVGRLAVAAVLCGGLAACNTTKSRDDRAEINTRTKFSEASYGVKASERVTTSRFVQKGGGRYQVGKPYKVAGRWYKPAEDPDYNKSGLASWYGPNFHGRYTANGEIYDQYHLSAAHPTFPLPSYARVINEENGNSVIVRVNDRGPFAKNRIIDVSSEAAELLDMKRDGVAKVRVQYVGLAPLDGNDMPFLMASYHSGDGQGGGNGMGFPGGQIATGVMVASNAPAGSPDLPGVVSPEGTTQPVLASASLPGARGTLASGEGSASLALMQEDSPSAPSTVFATLQPALLPDVGPIPQDRPSLEEPLDGRPAYVLASAFAEERLARPSAEAVFSTVLAPSTGGGLTEAAILASWQRHFASGNRSLR